MRNFKELKVWQKAHRFVVDVYQLSRPFPSDERFGLTAHLRKSATSVPSNIAEGCGRDGERELARDLGYLQHDDHQRLEEQVTEVRRMLYSFIQRLS